MKIFSFIVFCLISQFAFSQPQQAAKGHFIRFYKADNQVKVYLNDSLLFTSKVFDGNPDLNLDVNLAPHLAKGLNSIKVELYNGYENNDYKEDRFWEIRYEMFNNNQSIDYMHQFSSNGAAGLAFEYKHEIYKK
ncbi:MAG: hypothetical protein RIG68_07340 [Imperialibacter sp.]|uniref:hypothetical protein n=1 Tax=Imperialibacter sp. TaxID=2038411 RepID=UPI0032F0996A